MAYLCQQSGARPRGCWPSFEAAQVRNALAKSKVRYIPKPVSSRAAVAAGDLGTSV